MTVFKKNDTVALENGESVKVTSDMLGFGGQGEVYRVSYNGRDMALKWYTSREIWENRGFKENLRSNIASGSPDPSFLWPVQLTAERKDVPGYGYIMPLIPDGYESFSDVLRTYRLKVTGTAGSTRIPVRFESLEAICNAALNIVRAFKTLHNRGYSYQDLNDGGFFFDLKTGATVVCDCDNVAPYGSNFGIAGKPGYMAPEVMTHEKVPDAHTDRFSLADVLFRLFIRGDPLLDGGRAVGKVNLTGAAELELYGTDPLFIFDPVDKRNSPVIGIHNNVLALWDHYCPQYLKDAFTRSFTVGLKDPMERVTDSEWASIVKRVRAEAVSCPRSGRQNYFSTCNRSAEPNVYVCPHCGRSYALIDVGGCRSVLADGVGLFGDETIPGGDGEFLTVTGRVSESQKHPGVFGIRNMTDREWTVRYSDGSARTVPAGKVAPVDRGSVVEFGKYRNNESRKGTIL